MICPKCNENGVYYDESGYYERGWKTCECVRDNKLLIQKENREKYQDEYKQYLKLKEKFG